MLPRIYFGSRHLYMNIIKDNFSENKLVFVDDLDKQLGSYFPIFDSKNIYIHDNPNSEVLKKISTLLDKNITNHILLFDDDGFDGRISIIQKIKKNNQIFPCMYPVLGDFMVLNNLIIKYIKSKSLIVSSETINWLITNCPILKIKNKTTKKEILYYDIDILFKEIEKISFVTNELTIEHFSNSNFIKQHDIFDYFKRIFTSDSSYINQNLNAIIAEFTTQGFFLILLQQLHFALVIADCQERKIFSPDKVQEMLELRDYSGKYYSDDYDEVKFSTKPHNPIRIKIALSENKLTSKKVSKMIDLVTKHISDARFYGESDVANIIVINKLANV